MQMSVVMHKHVNLERVGFTRAVVCTRACAVLLRGFSCNRVNSGGVFFFFPLQYIHSFIDGHVCVDEERSRPVQRGHFGGHWLRVRYSVPRGEGDLCAVCSGVVSEYFVQSR